MNIYINIYMADANVIFVSTGAIADMACNLDTSAGIVERRKPCLDEHSTAAVQCQ